MRTVPLHDNVRVMSDVGDQTEASRIVAEVASRLLELGDRCTFAAVGALIRDLAAYSQMGRGVGPLAGMELRLILCVLAGDVGQLREAHSDATANGCSRQAHHLMMHQALDRIAKRSPQVADVLRELRAINFEPGEKLEEKK